MYPQNLTAEGYPKPNILAKSTTVLSAYGGTQLTQHGICKIPCEFNGKKSVASFFVTEAEGPAIIGLPTSLELDLGTLSCSVQKKSTPDGKSTDPNMALLCLRATPVDNKLASPAELLLGRPVQDNLPRKIPSSVNGEEVVQQLQDKQAKQKAYHDQHDTALPSLVPGQSVTIRNHKTHTWEPAVVQEQLHVPRSYVVITPTGGNLRRNRSQIREVHSKRVQFDLDQDETTPQVESPQLEQPQATQSTGSNTGSDTPYVTRYGRSIKTPKRMDS